MSWLFMSFHVLLAIIPCVETVMIINSCPIMGGMLLISAQRPICLTGKVSGLQLPQSSGNLNLSSGISWHIYHKVAYSLSFKIRWLDRLGSSIGIDFPHDPKMPCFYRLLQVFAHLFNLGMLLAYSLQMHRGNFNSMSYRQL